MQNTPYCTSLILVVKGLIFIIAASFNIIKSFVPIHEVIYYQTFVLHGHRKHGYYGCTIKFTNHDQMLQRKTCISIKFIMINYLLIISMDTMDYFHVTS